MQPCKSNQTFKLTVLLFYFNIKSPTTLKPCFHMYSICPYMYVDPDPIHVHINDPHYFILNCFHIYTYCPVLWFDIRFDHNIERFNHIQAICTRRNVHRRCTYLCIYKHICLHIWTKNVYMETKLNPSPKQPTSS